MDDDELYLEDWKMTKDRIKHFDDILVRIRLGAVPIATALIGAGILAVQHASEFRFYSLTAPSLLFMASALYMLALAVFDSFHYELLRKAVEHARDLERNYFKNKLQITNKLTSHSLTQTNVYVAIIIYISMIGIAIALAMMFSS